MNAPLLDCSSLDSTRESIAAIFQTCVPALDSIFDAIDIETLARKHPDLPGDRLLFQAVGQSIAPSTQFAVAWFHLTRVIDPTVFDRGLLPLGQALDHIW